MPNDDRVLIRIGPYDYHLTEDASISRGGSVGQIDVLSLTIQIVPGLPAAVFQRVLYHEIIHGILDAAGIDQHDEHIVDAIAGGLVQVFRDNPSVAGRFVDREDDDEAVEGDSGHAE